MLYLVQNELPSVTQFTFNLYRHWGAFVIRYGEGAGHFLYRKEGVTKGDPVAMIMYVIGALPLMRGL